MAVGGVDHEDVDAQFSQRLCFDVGLTVDPDGDAEHQPALGVDSRPVDRRAQRTVAGDDADQSPLVVDDRGEGSTLHGQLLERRHGVDSIFEGDELAADGHVKLGEAVVPGRIALVEDTERCPTFVDDNHGAVGPLVDQRQRVADRVVRRQRDRRLVQRVAALDVVDDRPDDVERDVLGKHGQPAAAGHRLGHPPPGHGGHVGDNHRQRRADPVGRREVDIETRPDAREVGNHEHVVVGQVVTGVGMEHAHGRSRLRQTPIPVLGHAPDVIGVFGDGQVAS